MNTATLKNTGKRHAGAQCTLDGKRAKVTGRGNQFATIAILPDGYSCEFTWPQVARIMATGGEFKSQYDNAESLSVEVTTTGTGYFKPGLKAVIVGMAARTVFLGSNFVETIIPEFTLEFPAGNRKARCQLGRDFVLDEFSGNHKKQGRSADQNSAR